MSLKKVKSNNTIRLIFSAFILCSILLITSCENFMKGSDYKNLLESAIEYSNAPYAKITITSEGTATASIVPAAGSYTDKYKAGDSFEVKFEPQPAYNFIKWIATPGDAVKFEQEGELNTRVTIKSVDDPIIIQPYALPKDKATIHFSAQYGTTVPAEEKRLYLGDEFSLSYREESGYAFIGWKIIDELNGEEVTDVLELSGNGVDITVKVLDVNRKVTVMAETAVRPKVVSATPLYDTSGVYRDRRIIVMFDKKMNADSSIYFSQDELRNLSILNENEDLNTTILKSGYKLLFDSKNENKCYGYCKDNDSNSYVFKNILITKRTDETVNLLQHFNAPYFDKNDSSVLRIDANSSNPPPSATDILVTIKKGVSYNSINLTTDYSWTYYTNGKTDIDAPKFEDFTVQFADANQTVYNQDSKSLEIDSIKFDTTKNDFDVDNYKNNNLKSRRIWVKGGFTDDGSGPSSLKWALYKINSNFYPLKNDYEKNHGKEIMTGKFDDMEVSTSNASLKDNGLFIDLTDIKTTDEGLYRIDFTCADKNELTETLSYYFTYDITPPASSSLDVVSFKGDGDMFININNNLQDFSYSNISGKKIGCNEKVHLDIPSGGYRKHIINYTNYDVCGNSKDYEVTVFTFITPGMIYYSDGYVSAQYLSDKTPVGVITDARDLTKVRIYDLNETTGKRWGSDNNPPGVTEYNAAYMNDPSLYGTDGLKVYNYFTGQSKCWNYLNSSNTIWYYLKYTKNSSSSIIWYAPDRKEIDYIFDNKSAIVAGFNTLAKNGEDAIFMHQDNTTGRTLRWWTARPTGWSRANVYRESGNMQAIDDDASAPLKTHEDYYLHCMAQVDLS